MEKKAKKTNWAALFEAGGTAICLWASADIFNEHEIVPLILSGCAVTIFLAGPCHFVFHHLGETKNARNAAIVLWLFVTVVLWLCVKANIHVPIANLKVEVGPQEEAKDPWGTPLLISNDGELNTSNLWGVYYWYDPEASKTEIFSQVALGISDELRTNDTIPFHLGSFSQSSDELFRHFGSKTWLNFLLRYKPVNSKEEKNQLFRFVVVRNSSGDFTWLPDGQGQTLQELQSQIDKNVTTLADIAPWVSLRMDALEDDSKANPAYPIKVDYSWKNFGGTPARSVYIQWEAIWPNGSPVAVWNHHDQFAPGILWPGDQTNASRLYTDLPEKSILRGLQSGRFLMRGEIHYLDIDTNEYQISITVLKTNNNFVYARPTLGGHFNELLNEVVGSNTANAQVQNP